MNKIFEKDKNGCLKEIDKIDNCIINWCGDNAKIVIGETRNINRLIVYMGESSFLEIGDDFSVRFNVVIDMKADNTVLRIGKNCNLGEGNIVIGDDKNIETIIGDDFLTALNFYIRNSDGHVLLNRSTGEVLNKSVRGITIGNHVWLGYDVKILKDVHLPDDVVVAAGAVVVNKPFQPHSVIGGVPANTIMSNTTWDSKNFDRYNNFDSK